MIDNIYEEKIDQIKFKIEETDKINIKDSLTEENNEVDEHLKITEKYFLLKKKYDFLIRTINIIKELIGIILFLFSYSYYYLSLEACLGGQEICSLLAEWQFTKVFRN
jgi:hypothetical protein